jgi:hypothetical protein
MEFRRTGRLPIPPHPRCSAQSLNWRPPDPKRFRRLGFFLRRSLDDEARRIAANIAKLPEMVWGKADGL